MPDKIQRVGPGWLFAPRATPEPGVSGRAQPLTGGALVIYRLWSHPLFSFCMYWRSTRRRVVRLARRAWRVGRALGWQITVGGLFFAASSLGLLHAYLFYSLLGVNIIEYAAIADYPVLAIKGLWWIGLGLGMAAIAWLLPPLMALLFGVPATVALGARYWRRRGMLTAEQCAREIERSGGWLGRVNGAFAAAYAVITAIYVPIAAPILLLALASSEAETVKAIRPDTEAWRPYRGLPIRRDPVCVRLHEGGYLAILDRDPPQRCQDAAVLLGTTSGWLLLKFSDGVKAVRREEVAALEVVDAFRLDKLRHMPPPPKPAKPAA